MLPPRFGVGTRVLPMRAQFIGATAGVAPSTRKMVLAAMS
jgi:hypothetical protein